VKKIAKLHLIEAFTQESGQHHEVIVMYPHIVIIWADHLHHLVSKNLPCPCPMPWKDDVMMMMMILSLVVIALEKDLSLSCLAMP
jgi:hypothetical protein